MQPWIVGGGAGGGKITFLKTHIKHLITGFINWAPSSVGVMDVKNIKVKTSISGIIGLDWMQAHQVIIDMSNNLLFVKSKNKESAANSTIVVHNKRCLSFLS